MPIKSTHFPLLRILPFLLLWGAGSGVLFAQKNPEIVWQKLYGGSLYDNGMSFLVTEDNAFVVAGTTQSADGHGKGNHSLGGKEDILVMKLVADGRIMWRTLIGGTGIEDFAKMRQCPDGGYIIVGTTQSNDGDFINNHGKMDLFLAKLNRAGDLEWSKCYGGLGNDKGFAVWPTAAGGYLIGGESGSATGDMRITRGGLDFWIARLDNKGEILYSRSLGGTKNDRVNDIMELEGGRILIIGSTTSIDLDVPPPIGQKDVWALVLSRNNDVVWQKNFGGSNFDDIYFTLKNKNGNIMAAGTSFSNDGMLKSNQGMGDMWVMEFTPWGDLIWSKSYGGTKQDGCNSITETPDGGYLLFGSSNSENGPVTRFKGHYDGLVIKIDSMGREQWSFSGGGEDYEEFFGGTMLPNGDCMVLGYAESEDGDLLPTGKLEQNDFWLVKLSFVEGGLPFNTRTILTGWVTDNKSGKPLKSEVRLTENKSMAPLNSSLSDSLTGFYKVEINGTEERSVNVSLPGYMFFGKDLDMKQLDVSPEIRMDVKLDSIRMGAKVILNLIFFDTGKWDLKIESNPELMRLLNFLNLNSKVKIEISGHTDDTGVDATKTELSLKRAEQVRNWMLKKGISGYRMTVKGFGMQQPLASNESEEGRAKNRRVEVMVTALK